MSKALITGITGQVGSYMAEYLLDKGYEVHGLNRRKSVDNNDNIKHILNEIQLIEGDLTDPHCINHVIQAGQYDCIVSLGAQSHVGSSFEQPTTTFEIDAVGPLNILEAIRHYSKHTRMYQASSVKGDTPVLVRVNGKVQLVLIEQLYKNKEENNGTEFPQNLEVLTLNRATGKGVFKKVKAIIKHKKQNIRSFRVRGCSIPIEVTDCHSLMIFNKNEILEAKVLDMYKNKLSPIGLCGNVTDNKPKAPLSFNFVKMDKKYETRYLNKQPILLTEDFCRLLGYYVSEGYGEIRTKKYKNSGLTTRLVFTFNIKERNYINDVCNICKNLGYNPAIRERPDSNSTQVVVCGKQLVHTVVSLCGCGAHKKRLPQFLWDYKDSYFYAFLRGYIGDAYFSPQGVVFTTVSKMLATDLLWRFRLCNVPARVCHRVNKVHLSPQKTIIKESTCYDVKVSLYHSYLLFPDKYDKFDNSKSLKPSVCCLPPEAVYGGNIYKNILKDRLGKGTIDSVWKDSVVGASPIKDVSDNLTEDFVYDLSVEGEETFFGGFCPILLHNTSELYGASKPPQNEDTPLMPQSPYGCAKLAAHHMVRIYSQAYGLKAACGYMFNTESKRRGDNFVTKKITNWGVALRTALRTGSNPLPTLYLGNMDAKRDWSHALDSVDAIYRIMHQDEYNARWDGVWKPYAFGSGKAYSVRDFLTIVLSKVLGTETFEFVGTGTCEHVNVRGQMVVAVDLKYYRPAEVDYLLCDPTKIKTELRWSQKYTFEQLVDSMLEG